MKWLKDELQASRGSAKESRGQIFSSGFFFFFIVVSVRFLIVGHTEKSVLRPRMCHPFRVFLAAACSSCRNL